METIHLLGVSHIKPNVSLVLEEISKLSIDKNTLVFIEPKKNIVLGIETYDNKSVGHFFSEILRYLMLKKAKIVPLNPRLMPSHGSPLLYHKYAKQFAEEEYMVSVIEKIKHNGDKVVIIGDVHAVRINRLLHERGCRTEYVKLSPITPDDLISISWKAALEGRSSEFISIEWLRTINEKLREKMNLSAPKVQEACWNDGALYQIYLELVTELMKEHKPGDFTIPVNEQIKELAREATESGKGFLERFKTMEDHPILSSPYTMKIAALVN